MSQARITETDFYEFSDGLRSAADAGSRIEKADKKAWMSWVRAHKVPEAACLAQARAKTTDHHALKMAIINAGAWIGYYVYSADEMFCLRFVPAQPDPGAEPTAPAPSPPADAAPAEDPAPAADSPAETSDPPEQPA